MQPLQNPPLCNSSTEDVRKDWIEGKIKNRRKKVGVDEKWRKSGEKSATVVWLENAGRIGWIKGGVEIGVEEEVKNGKVSWKKGGVRTEEMS